MQKMLKPNPEMLYLKDKVIKQESHFKEQLSEV